MCKESAKGIAPRSSNRLKEDPEKLFSGSSGGFFALPLN